MQKRLLLLLWCWCWCSGLAIAAAEEAPRMAIIDFYPFGYVADDQKPRGMVFEIAEIIEQLSGVTIDTRLMSVPRALRSASVGQNDLLFSYKDEVMVPNVIWLGNIGCLVPLLVHRKDSGIRTLADLAGKRVGYVGLGYFDTRRKNDWAILPKPLNNNFLMLKMLQRGRVDAIVINNAVLNAFLFKPEILPELEPGWEDMLAQPLVLDMFETHLSMSRDSSYKHLIPALRRAIVKGRTEGRFEKIFIKWGSQNGGHCYNKQQLKYHRWL